MDRAQLADFLRRRRAALQPEDVGLNRGPRRRTAGLRREEVAALCDMSVDYYSRLEHQRGPQPSEQMIAAIARGASALVTTAHATPTAIAIALAARLPLVTNVAGLFSWARPGDLLAADASTGTVLVHPAPTDIERLSRIPSLAYRLAMIADARMDATLVMPNSHDWDLAAAHLILGNAGGKLTDTAGRPLRFNAAVPRHGVLVAASGPLHPRILRALPAALA